MSSTLENITLKMPGKIFHGEVGLHESKNNQNALRRKKQKTIT
jgi:hypothetical protein